MDSYFLNNQGEFQSALYTVYQEIKNRMRYNMENYIASNIGYTIDSDPILMDVLNTPDIYKAIESKIIEITKECFEQNIPNEQVGSSYVDSYYSGANFSKFVDDNETTYIMIVKTKIVMFFEIENKPV